MSGGTSSARAARAGALLCAVTVAAGIDRCRHQAAGAAGASTKAASTRPASTRPAAAEAVTDAAVRGAIARGVAFLYSRQGSDGRFPNPHSRQFVGGAEALVALALLRAGEPADSEKLGKTLQMLAVFQPEQTYPRALRAMVYSLLPGKEDRNRLTKDVQWLVKQQDKKGGWGYGPRSAMALRRRNWADGSNSQLAVLALREAAEAGILVPLATFNDAEFFWRRFQNDDGGWGYQPKLDDQPPRRAASYGSMTAAAVASYFIFADRLGANLEGAYQPGQKRADGGLLFADRIARGLKWLADNYRLDKVPKYVWQEESSLLHYYLFCLQRAGEAAGLRTFGRNDYSAQIARFLLTRQKTDGSWGGSVLDTAFALLVLARARAPVAIARLQLGAAGGRDPRDAAHVARWLSRQVGRRLAWRHVPLEEVAAAGGSRLLYLNPKGGSSLPLGLGKSLAGFMRRGGTCLIQASGAKSAGRIAAPFEKSLTGCRSGTLDPDHPVFKLRFAVDPKRCGEIIGLGDVCRTRLFILAKDISGAWHQGRSREFPELFGLAGNLVLYSGGGKLPPGKFTAGAAAPAEAPAVRGLISIARLKHAGDYDICPRATRRLSEALARSLSMGLKERPPVPAARAIDPAVAVLWLTGTIPPKLSRTEKTNIRDYLSGGGTLLIDPAIGGDDFRDAALKLLKDIFRTGRVEDLKPDHPLVTGSFAGGIGADLTALRLLRRGGAGASSPAPAKLWAGSFDGRIAAVLSANGLTCSIDGTPCVKNVGYVPDDARKVALNVILYAVTRQAGGGP